MKTIEVFATDNAGSVGNKVTYTFNLNDGSLKPPPPTTAPSLSLAITPSAVRGTTTGTDTGAPITISITNQPTPLFIGTVSVGATVQVTEFESNSANGPWTLQYGTLITPTIGSNGSFTFSFENPQNLSAGYFKVQAVAGYTNYPSVGTTTDDVYIQISDTTPAAVTDFRLDPADDTGIVGDDITSDHAPFFIGTAPEGDSVVLVVNGVVSSTPVIAGATTDDINGQPYDFAIESANAFFDGTATMQAIVTDAISGNTSPPSNPATVTFVSIASDYNGDNYSDAALYDPSTGQWLVQTTSEVPPLTFMGALTMGSASVTYPSTTMGLVIGQTITGTGIPAGTTILAINSSTTLTLSANATATGTQSLSAAPPPFWFTSGTTFPASPIPTADAAPFQGDFDGDGKADLAVYNLATATWYMDDSKTGLIAPFQLGTPNVSVPVVGYFNFNANLPEEVAVYTFANGQGTWSINTNNAGVQTVVFPGAESGDIPVPGNYTGVGYDELALYRPGTGQYLVQLPGTTLFSGTLTSGSNSVTGISSATGLFVGETIAGTGIPSGTTILTINSTTGTITLSANATVSGSLSLAAPAPKIINPPTGIQDVTSLVPVPGNYDPHQISTSFMGTLTAGSELVTGLSSTTGLVVGQTVTGTAPAFSHWERPFRVLTLQTAPFCFRPMRLIGGSQSLTASQWIENTEAAWYDPKTGLYTIQGPSSVETVAFQANDIPVPADYMGTGITQPAVYRPSTDQFIEQVNGQPTVIATFAQATGDIPLAAPWFYRMPGDPPATGTGGGSTGTGSGGSTGTGSGGSTGTGSGGSTGTGSGGSTGTGSGGSGGTGSTSTGTTGSGSSSTPPPAQSPTSGKPSTGTHKVTHKKTVSHPAPKPHAKKPAKPVAKKAAPKPKPKVKVHVVSHPADKVVTVSTASTSAQKHAHVVDLALQDIHVNLLRKNSRG